MKKSFKRLVASILSAAMMFTMMSGVMAAVPDDAKESPYTDAIEVLGALSIMVGDEKGNFNPSNKITRGEFTRVAVSMLGLDALAEASNYQTKFPDVPKNYWGNGYINVAASQNIVVGDEKGYFNPLSEITYAEAIAMLVRIAGYEPKVADNGGWPNGYLSVGQSIGTAEDLVLSAYTAVTREQIAKMTYNTLDTNIMVQTSYGQNISYEVIDKTVMEDKLSVERTEGILTATPAAGLDNTTSNKGEFKVGDKRFKTDGNVNDMLGQNVHVYVKNNKAILVQGYKNTILNIDPSDITKLTANDKRITVTYGKTDKKFHFNLDAAIYLEDGKMVKLTADNLDILKDGSALKAIDNDEDGTYDVLLSTQQRNIVVETVDTRSKRITDKLGNPSIVLDSDKYDISITKDGKNVSLSSIKEWDVLTIVEGHDKSYISVRVCNDQVTGKVTEEENGKFVIGEKTYEVAPNYTNKISIGDSGVFYLDVDGKIAAIDSSTKVSSNYAYLVNGIMGKYDETADLVFLSKDGKKAEVSTAESLKVNGEKKDAAEAFSLLTKDGKIVQQLITFETNKNNEVVEINLPTESLDIDENNFMLNATLTNAVYKETKGLLGKYAVTKDTIVFNIPDDSNKIEDFSVTDKSIFEDETGYDVLVYDANTYYEAKVVVVTNAEHRTPSDAAFAIVNKVTQTWTENGTVDRLYATINGEEVVLNAKENKFFVKDGDSLEKGDVIQYKVNEEKEIVDFRLVLDIQDRTTQKEENVNDDLTFKYGKVNSKTSRTIDLSVNDGEAETLYVNNAKVYTLTTDNKVVASSVSEISAYDEDYPTLVLVRVYKDDVTEIIVVEQEK